MSTKEELRLTVRNDLAATVARVNTALSGKKLKALEPVLKRLGRGGQLPHWFGQLKSDGTLPNLDGKTIGSVVEMLLVAVLETTTLAGLNLPPLKMNPARGVDLPDLDLGVKSPSKNYCTSEPYFSAYERLLGTQHDVLVLITDYQVTKKKPPLRLQLTKCEYLTKTQVADESLCRLAREQRGWLVACNESWAKKAFRFLAFVNQSDWRAKWLMQLLSRIQDDDLIRSAIAGVEADFARRNADLAKKDKPLLPDSDLEAVTRVLSITPLHLGVIGAADNWVVEVQKDMGRLPNDNEWQRLLASPLDGRIGISPALQWRYNFGKVFGVKIDDDAED